MAKPNRTAYARNNAAWLIPVFGAVLLLGILLQNIFAMAGGVFGLIWVARAVWKRQ